MCASVWDQVCVSRRSGSFQFIKGKTGKMVANLGTPDGWGLRDTPEGVRPEGTFVLDKKGAGCSGGREAAGRSPHSWIPQPCTRPPIPRGVHRWGAAVHPPLKLAGWQPAADTNLNLAGQLPAAGAAWGCLAATRAGCRRRRPHRPTAPTRRAWSWRGGGAGGTPSQCAPAPDPPPQSWGAACGAETGGWKGVWVWVAAAGSRPAGLIDKRRSAGGCSMASGRQYHHQHRRQHRPAAYRGSWCQHRSARRR